MVTVFVTKCWYFAIFAKRPHILTVKDDYYKWTDKLRRERSKRTKK